MKNISEKLNNFPMLRVSLTLWGLASLYLFSYPLHSYKITQQRANYFIVKSTPADNITNGSRGNLYLEDQNSPVGRFKVLEVYDNECLCVMVSINPGIDSGRICRISFTPGPPREKLPLVVNGLRFIHPGGNRQYYLSVPAIPLKTIEPVSIAGIKNLLFEIENENPRFSAGLIHFSQIHPLGLDKIIDFTDKNKIYLGIRDDKPGMIYLENGVFQFTGISSLTLKKFKNDIFFHVLLVKKER